MKNIVIIIFCMTFLTGCKTAPDTENEIHVSSETMEDKGKEIYEMLKEYMWDEVVDTFSPYYELIDYRITNYKEDTDEKLTEALFNYKVIYKNFDKDPDTVEYIRKAKETNDPNYKVYYKAYLEPIEMNMEIKAVVDENGNITLYTDVDPTVRRKWVEFEMSDCILN